MRGYRKNKRLIYALLLLLSSGHVSYAGDSFVKIEQAKLVLTQNNAKLIADLDFQLSATVQEALHSGIVLYWDVSIVLKQKQWAGLWHKTLLAQTNRYSLSYYTLLDNYRLKSEQKQVFIRFSSLSDALLYMRHIVYAELPMQARNVEQCVIAVLNVTFAKEMLPVPLRPIAYFDKQWDLSANERQWCD
ncbi:MAG: DUF4390 domain-containing protein [Methyloprofundus sp.]|nr:DUF4390 domain-containing protein [Methyloprofundus sp.]